MSRPGDRLRSVAARVYSATTMERLIDPVVADLQKECSDAAGSGERWRRGWLLLGGYGALLKVVVAAGWSEAMAPHRSWALDDRRALTRTLGLTSFFIVILTVVLEQPFLTVVLHPFSVDPRLLLYLVPQALPIAVTVGATLGIVCGLGGRPFSRRVSAWIVGLALVASVVSFVNLAWITPAANQAYRIIVSGRADLAPGVPELTLGELGRQIELAARGRPMQWPLDIAFNYHTRWALACSPLVLTLFALTMVRAGSVKRWALGVVACGAFFGYYLLLYGGRYLVLGGSVPAYAAAWVPNLCIGLVSVVFTAMRSRRLGLAS